MQRVRFAASQWHLLYSEPGVAGTMVTWPRGSWAQELARAAFHRLCELEHRCRFVQRVSLESAPIRKGRSRWAQVAKSPIPLLEVQDDFSLPFSPARMPELCSETVEACRRPEEMCTSASSLAVCMLHCRGRMARKAQGSRESAADTVVFAVDPSSRQLAAHLPPSRASSGEEACKQHMG